MKRILLEPEFEAWRGAAREALRLGYRPEELDLQDSTAPTTLELALESSEVATGEPVVSPHVPKAFLEAARFAAVHRDTGRWNLLYRVLYRLQANRDLLKNEVDDDVAQMLRLEGQVRRDLHKMHAFVRFRMVLEPGSAMARPVVIDEPVLASADPSAHHLVLATPTPFGVTRREVPRCEPDGSEDAGRLAEDGLAAFDPHISESRYGAPGGDDWLSGAGDGVEVGRGKEDGLAAPPQRASALVGDPGSLEAHISESRYGAPGGDDWLSRAGDGVEVRRGKKDGLAAPPQRASALVGGPGSLDAHISESMYGAPGGSGGCEHFVAWYEPDHRILPLAAPFFAERFGIMRWSILTPEASVSWDPVTKRMAFGPGVPRESAPAEDELEELWRTYYASIYNPARLNPEAMRSEMPVRYWKNLPEVSLLPELITKSHTRVSTMVTAQQQKPTAEPFVPAQHTLSVIRAALPECKGCDLYRHATQAVPGRGMAHAALMLVGEQPGDQEDVQGEPFVGPAGKLLGKIMEEVGIVASEVFVTNAVKHFKYVQRGKLRLHQSPRMSEISACRPWLLAEVEAVQPKLILCLGASASKALLGGTFALMREHGKVRETPYARQVMATIHPSAVLRARDESSRKAMHEFLATDLALAWEVARKTVA